MTKIVTYTQTIEIFDEEALRACYKQATLEMGIPYWPDDLADMAVWALEQARTSLEFGIEVVDSVSDVTEVRD